MLKQIATVVWSKERDFLTGVHLQHFADMKSY